MFNILRYHLVDSKPFQYLISDNVYILSYIFTSKLLVQTYTTKSLCTVCLLYNGYCQIYKKHYKVGISKFIYGNLKKNKKRNVELIRFCRDKYIVAEYSFFPICLNFANNTRLYTFYFGDKKILIILMKDLYFRNLHHSIEKRFLLHYLTQLLK